MISLINPTGRNTECRAVTIGNVTLYFSYETFIGAEYAASHYPLGSKAVRVANSWGPTTGRHFHECGLRDAQVVNRATLEAFALQAFDDQGSHDDSAARSDAIDALNTEQ